MTAFTIWHTRRSPVGRRIVGDQLSDRRPAFVHWHRGRDPVGIAAVEQHAGGCFADLGLISCGGTLLGSGARPVWIWRSGRRLAGRAANYRNQSSAGAETAVMHGLRARETAEPPAVKPEPT